MEWGTLWTRGYDLVVDPRNETLTYAGAHALWQAGRLEEWTTPRW